MTTVRQQVNRVPQTLSGHKAADWPYVKGVFVSVAVVLMYVLLAFMTIEVIWRCADMMGEIAHKRP